MVNMMVLVAYLMTADGVIHASIQTQPIPSADCLRVSSLMDALPKSDNPIRYVCIPASGGDV